MRKLIWLFCAVLVVLGVAKSGDAVLNTYALTEEESVWVEEARGALQEILKNHEVMALVYLSDEYPIRESASYESKEVLNVPSGQMVTIHDVLIDDNYEAWEYVSLYYGTEEYYGYIPRTYLACSDEVFLEWEANYGMNPAAATPYTVDAEGAKVYSDIEQFPESYQTALKALKEKYPNWTFVKMKTELDWDTVIENEILYGRSLVHKSVADCMKEGLYDTGSWYYASEEALEYYMDPRNSLTEENIFQFEQLTYNATYHTEAAVESFLKNTFMNNSKKAPGTDMVFSHIFWSVGADASLQVSPFHLASRVYQEQGEGTSPLISGTYAGYEGYYNYFNVKASGVTNEEIYINGLGYAKEQNWNNAYESIKGGAKVVSQNYIRRGQDTLYLQKFNVNPNGYYALYTHQYMQNISAPFTEAKSIKKLYQEANSLDNTFTFKIPVFENMPDKACEKPVSSTNVALKIPEDYSDTTVYLDGVDYTAIKRDGRYIVTASNNEAKTAIAYKYNEDGVPVGMYVWTLKYENGAYQVTEQPELEDLLTYHGFSIRITGKSGIRFKTGISKELRENLTKDGINGYVLKEYGTLVMNQANREEYPMVTGGEKVLFGMSYGKTEDGKLEDKVYETVNGRHRYTSVLVGVPAKQYKTEYAFRGYITLKKGKEEITLYGPIVAKSIYNLANQVLSMGSYKEGSNADVFLKQLISDADKAAQ